MASMRASGRLPAVLRILALLSTLMSIGISGASASSVYRIEFPFIDDRGRQTVLQQWKGRPAIVTMEYANCRFICSITLQRLKDVQAAADRARRQFDFIILSIDPKNDTPEAWTRYRKTRELDRANWYFLTASVQDTPELARQLGVRYWLYDEHIMHDFRLLRLDEAGEIVKVMDTYDADLDAFVR
jgi:protein SCO1/2